MAGKDGGIAKRLNAEVWPVLQLAGPACEVQWAPYPYGGAWQNPLASVGFGGGYGGYHAGSAGCDEFDEVCDVQHDYELARAVQLRLLQNQTYTGSQAYNGYNGNGNIDDGDGSSTIRTMDTNASTLVI